MEVPAEARRSRGGLLKGATLVNPGRVGKVLAGEIGGLKKRVAANEAAEGKEARESGTVGREVGNGGAAPAVRGKQVKVIAREVKIEGAVRTGEL